jgi:hypothetical protein
MPKCSIEYYNGCRFDKYGGYDECILHCPKDKMSFSNNPYFTEFEMFYEYLIEYIIENINYEDINNTQIKDYFNDKPIDKAVQDEIDSVVVVFNQIHFPNSDRGERFDYLKILKKLKAIHFNCCHFYISSLEIGNTKCFFQDCEFHKRWPLNNFDILENTNNVIYQMCIFNKDVYSSSEFEYKNNQFYACKFNSILSFNDITISKQLFNGHDDFEPKIKHLIIDNCILKDKFILKNTNMTNSRNIETVMISNTVFENEFYFENNISENFKINNCEFKQIADFNKTKFISFIIEKTSFDDYVIFSNCEFGNKEDNKKDYITKFKYTTFNGFINFNDTKFYNGLVLDGAHMAKDASFFNIYIAYENTTRETFRIIKHSFDKVGNIIEANKFFSFEMKKYKNELKGKSGHHQEKFVFFTNEFFSNFGQSYIKPFVLLLLITFIYSLQNYNSICDILLNYDINTFPNSILPYRKLSDNMDFMQLIVMIIQLILIWHIIVAFKRHTKR